MMKHPKRRLLKTALRLKMCLDFFGTCITTSTVSVLVIIKYRKSEAWEVDVRVRMRLCVYSCTCFEHPQTHPTSTIVSYVGFYIFQCLALPHAEEFQASPVVVTLICVRFCTWSHASEKCRSLSHGGLWYFGVVSSRWSPYPTETLENASRHSVATQSPLSRHYSRH